MRTSNSASGVAVAVASGIEVAVGGISVGRTVAVGGAIVIAGDSKELTAWQETMINAANRITRRIS